MNKNDRHWEIYKLINCISSSKIRLELKKKLFSFFNGQFKTHHKWLCWIRLGVFKKCEQLMFYDILKKRYNPYENLEQQNMCKILKFIELIIHNVHWLPKTFAVESWHKHTSAWLSRSPLFWVTQTTHYWPVLEPGHFSTLSTAPNPQYPPCPVFRMKFHWKAWTVEFWNTLLPKSIK